MDQSRRNWIKYALAGVGGIGLEKVFGAMGGRGDPPGGSAGGGRWLDPFGAGAEAPPAPANGDVVPQPIRENLGHYIYLAPQKLGGGTHAVDLEAMKTLAWISYWTYGDSCPISHHLAAFPADSGDPYKGFEFVNSTQGGDNVLMYGLKTNIQETGMLGKFGEGNHIYRVGYDGKSNQMELLEDISKTTGIGLGVHTCIYPDGEGFACADGQKDVAAFFSRARGNEKTTVQMAFRADWVANSPFLGETWIKGGKIRLTRLTPSKELGVYDYYGTKGNKINYEMAPMAELLVERGQLPGDSPQTLTGLDFAQHDTRGRFSMMCLRMCGGAICLDRKNWEPVCFLYAAEQGQDNVPVKKVSSSPDTYEVDLPAVHNPTHEAGFNPAGSHWVMMNNLRANNVAVFNVDDPDPRKWKRFTHVRSPDWTGEYPSPFHVCFSSDGTKMFLSVLRPKPMKSDVVVVSTKNWQIIKTFRNVGVDSQTMHVTYDGKYVIQIFSGFQRMEAGAFVFRQDTLDEVGYMPNFGGHHDCVVVPKSVDELKWSRCCTV
jgi:hypothetical protein